MQRELLAIDIKLKPLCLFALFVDALAKRELVIIMCEVIGHLKNIHEVFRLPAHLWLAADVQSHLATTDCILNNDWCLPSLKADEPVESPRVGTEKLIGSRVTYFRHLCHFDPLG